MDKLTKLVPSLPVFSPLSVLGSSLNTIVKTAGFSFSIYKDMGCITYPVSTVLV